ncbi:hypothetical protein DE146DRAFT_631223 [Phaeosphaeria sp. MPI-PUGE-AT-0046c]|nr:hypothetical protein DE146DRAFT_631223 [Phaeosphaeria sp. MPI-PUGE-AT-0046c]
MRRCVAEGTIIAEDYSNPEKRQMIVEEYKETIEELLANGNLVRRAKSVTQYGEKIRTTPDTSRLYSSTSVRKRLITVTGKGETARLTYSRCRKTRYYYLLSVARKRTVSLRCYAVCPLACRLLGTKPTLQRHLQKATKILLAEDATAPQDLHAAWDKAAVA